MSTRKNDRVTMYGVQTFVRKGAKLVAEAPRVATSETAAKRMAETLAATKAGVMAYKRERDADLGEFDEPVILASHGQVPAQDAF